jgi:hypothetical protein
MGGASALVDDLERKWPRAYGEVFRDRYGRGDDDIGERGEEGTGSVTLRSVGGLLFVSPSSR